MVTISLTYWDVLKHLLKLASAKASKAGRVLAILGKQIKPAYKLEIEKILHEINPQLEFDKPSS